MTSLRCTKAWCACWGEGRLVSQVCAQEHGDPWNDWWEDAAGWRENPDLRAALPRQFAPAVAGQAAPLRVTGLSCQLEDISGTFLASLLICGKTETLSVTWPVWILYFSPAVTSEHQRVRKGCCPAVEEDGVDNVTGYVFHRRLSSASCSTRAPYV